MTLDATKDSHPPHFALGWMITALSAANFVVGIGTFVVVGLLLLITESHGLSVPQGGMLMTVFAISFAILSPVLSALTGRWDRRLVLALAMLAFAIGSAATALAGSFEMLCLARIVAAAGAAIITPVSAVVAAQHSPDGKRGRALAGVIVGVTLAQIVGVPGGVWLGEMLGWQTVFWLVAALCIPVIAALWLSLPGGIDFVPVTLKDLGMALRNPLQMSAVSFTVLFVGGMYVVYTYIAPLLRDGMGWSSNGLIVFLAFAGFGAVVGNLLGGVAVDKLGPTRTLLGLCCAQIFVLPLFSMLPLTPVALIAAAITGAAFGWAAGAAQQARLLAMDAKAGPVLIAVNAGAGYVAAAFGASIGGLMVTLYSVHALGWTGALVILSAAVALVLVDRWTQKVAN